MNKIEKILSLNESLIKGSKFIEIIIIILILATVFIIPSIILFKLHKQENSDEPFLLKQTALFFGSSIFFIIVFALSSSVYSNNAHSLDNCGNFCTNYTNSNINIILGLFIQLINIIIYYKFFKRILIFFHTHKSKLKYLIISLYTLIVLCVYIFGIFIYAGFLGHFIINNIILNILRYLVIYMPLLIYFIDIFIIEFIIKTKVLKK